MTIDPIKVKGLNEFSRNLKKLDSNLPKALRLANNEAASIVVNYAMPKVPRGPGKGGHAASSVKAKSTRTSARVTGGGNRFPYYPWVDFGGRVGRKKSVRRAFYSDGRYIYPGYYLNQDEVYAQLLKSLVGVADEAEFHVAGGGQ